jgi:hypothetical protein
LAESATIERKQLRNPQTTLATLAKLPVALTQQPDLVEKRFRSFTGLQGFSMQTFKLRLVVKGIEMTEATAEAQMDDSRSPRGMLRSGR